MKIDEKAAEKFTALMIEKIKTMTENWRKPWISERIVSNNFKPRNIKGRAYAGGNAFMLLLLCEQKGYEIPVFLTFPQAQAQNVTVTTGEKAFPVYYFSYLVFHKVTNKRISYEDYQYLTPDEQKQYRVTVLLKFYNVFNLDQTNFKTVNPEKYEKIKQEFTAPVEPEISGKPEIYTNPLLDNMLEGQTWECPVRLVKQDQAYYSLTWDRIVLPLKEQFIDGKNFYGTLLHEIGHSTGHPTRLNRDLKNAFGSNKYGREELVAELTSALCGLFLGISVTVRKENAAYLKSWLGSIRENPNYLFTTLNDAAKAVKYICSLIKVETGEEETTEIPAA